MFNSLTIINFDNLFINQNFYKEFSHNIIDLSHINNNIYYCEEKSLYSISNKIKNSQLSNIRYIGSGNYHYVTYLFLKDINEPFDLILIDNHTEMLDSKLNPYISCGSWILNLVEANKHLENIIMIGVSEEYIKLIPHKYLEKITVIKNDDIPFTNYKKKEIKKIIGNKKIYISVDKDVLREEDCITNWDHGDMKLSELLYVLKEFITNYQIIGIDFCGEYLNRQSNIYEYKLRKAIKLNNRANYNILKTIKTNYNI